MIEPRLRSTSACRICGEPPIVSVGITARKRGVAGRMSGGCISLDQLGAKKKGNLTFLLCEQHMLELIEKYQR